MDTNELIKVLEAEIYKLSHETPIDPEDSDNECFEINMRIESLQFRIAKLKAKLK